MASKAPQDPTIALLFGFVLGIVLFAYGLKKLRLKQRIENTPTSKVRSIAMGPVEVSGTVVASDEGLLDAPFTGMPCVYYRYKVEELRGSGKKRSWETVVSGSQSKRFFLKDDTGQVLVDPQGAEVEIPNDFLQAGRKDPSERIQAFLREHNRSHEGWFGLNKEMKYTEWRIAPEDAVFITGEAGDNPYVAEGMVVEGHKDVMISKGPAGNFFISDKSERQVIGELNFLGWGGVLAGFALGVGCLVMLFI